MASVVRIAVAQLNFRVGDIAGNAEKIIATARAARSDGAELVVFSELALTGYPPEDLLLRSDFLTEAEEALARLARRLHTEAPGVGAGVGTEVGVLVGAPRREGGRLFNSAFYLKDGKLLAHYDKAVLPNYSVFDEKRYFEAGAAPCVIEIGGVRAGVIVCEDTWSAAGPAVRAKQAGAEVLISINASPFHVGKSEQRDEILRARARETGLPIVYVNQTGGQDELVFDGDSRVVSPAGETLWSAPLFEEDVYVFDLPAGGEPECPPAPRPALSTEETIWRALVTGLRDYVNYNEFEGVVIGLSGGVDSALTLVLAAEAVGAGRVCAVMMPFRYTSQISLEDARTLAASVGVKLHEISIEPVFRSLEGQLKEIFAGAQVNDVVNGAADVTEENMQARARGNLLMAIANKHRLAVLATGNKSEMAVGYATLYGDMAGAYAPLKDVVKTRVYRLAEFCNRDRELIPRRVIERPPSAELAPGQTDQDRLPPYETLDAIIEQFIEADASCEEMVARGFPEETVRGVLEMVLKQEYKRRQAPPGVRITEKAFGKDRRYPITSGFDPRRSEKE